MTDIVDHIVRITDEICLRRFDAALAAHGRPAGFMNAASPGVIALFQPNDVHPDDDAYVEALAEAMRPECEAIVAAGSSSSSTAPTSAWAGT